MEKGRIPSTQLASLVIAFVLGSSLLFPPGGTAGHDAWLAIMLGLAEALVFVLIYTHLARRFPNHTIVQIIDIVFGRYLGKLVSLFFIWYLLHLGSLVLGNLAVFMTSAALQETPIIFFTIMVALVAVYAVTGGIEVISRSSTLLVTLLILAQGLGLIFHVPNMELSRLKPVLEAPLDKLLWAGHAAATFPFGETIVFAMIIPYLNKPNQARRSVVRGLLIAGLFLAILSARNAAVLGPTAGISLYPSFVAETIINIGRVLTRVEIVAGVGFITMAFLKVAVLLYGASLGVAQMLKLPRFEPIVVPLAMLMIALERINFDNVTENLAFSRVTYPIYALVFQVAIPSLTLLLSYIRVPARR